MFKLQNNVCQSFLSGAWCQQFFSVQKKLGPPNFYHIVMMYLLYVMMYLLYIRLQQVQHGKDVSPFFFVLFLDPDAFSDDIFQEMLFQTIIRCFFRWH